MTAFFINAASRQRRGRPALVPAAAMEAVRAELLRGPGPMQARWTIKGAARVIESVCGVEYSPTQVWRVLRGLGLQVRHAHGNKETK